MLEFYLICATRKINKMPEFYVFARKIFFPILGDLRPPHLPFCLVRLHVCDPITDLFTDADDTFLHTFNRTQDAPC